MREITLAQAAQWCGGSVAPEFAERTFRGANFDTRRLQPGELFVAITGARDGHDFARGAMEKGAAAVLASKALDQDIPAIYVQDTVTALQSIAARYRESLPLKCIGITGSVGKTTTKEMIAAVLSTTFRTEKTAENFNNGLGLPVTVLGLAEDCEAAVLEMGMNHFGELSVLTRIAQPDIAVITNIGTMHIENLGSREGILQAKLEILEGLRPGGTAIFNGDDDMLQTVGREAVRFGLFEDCDVRAVEIQPGDEAVRFTALAQGRSFPVELPVPGEHNVRNALAAIAVGLQLGVPVDRIQSGLAGFHNTGMRQKIYTLDGVTVIEDCYNAGPESMRAALAVLHGRKTQGRRIAVLGGMLELGAHAPQAHFEAGKAAAQAADLLFAYGENSEQYVAGAKGIPAKQYQTYEDLAQELRQTLRPGDVLLVKGSRGMRMERVLELLKNKG